MAFFCPQKKHTVAPADSSTRSPTPFKRPLPPIPTSAFSQGPPAPPSLHQQLASPFLRTRPDLVCRICATPHRPDQVCPSRPPEHPDNIYPACDICNGHHPQGYCYFDFLRAHLNIYSPCARCNGLSHIGFCKGSLQCKKCGNRHNGANTCAKRELKDLSNNICPNCRTVHIFHCSKELAQLDISISLWCNRCKLCHQFMRCTPFCNKCLRHHIESDTCPDPSDFCTTCMVSHFNKKCPRTISPPAKPTSPSSPQPPPNSAVPDSPDPISIPTPRSPDLSLKKRAIKRSRRLTNIARITLPVGPQTPPGSPPPLPSQQHPSHIYICPDDCDEECCKPVRFLKSPERLTPLPSFNERLI